MLDVPSESNVAAGSDSNAVETGPVEAWSVIPKLRHDLRTPLNQIIGYTEMLQEMAAEDLQSDLAKIRTAALTLVDSIDDAFKVIGQMLTGVTPQAPSVAPGPLAASRMLDSEPPPDDATALGQTYDGAAFLVVDDNEMNRNMLSRRLVRRGFGVETAESGEAALRALGERSFDLVLLDVVMPGMSGLEVLRRIRQTKTMAELPVIMATARDGSRDVVHALESGANDYVTKPIDMPVLLARANTQLALKDANERAIDLTVRLEQRNRFIRDAFGRYLTDEIVENLLATPEGLALGGEGRTATILMSDLRGFSSLSERLSPRQVVSLLNNYLGAMTKVIVKHEGTIDEFIGDAILVIFGAPVSRPDDAERAIACALEMQLTIEAVNVGNRAQDLPDIEMGIGINTGEVVVGNIGSDKRAKYGVVGRNVNLAARIEALTVGGQVLVSESTLAAAGPAVRVDGTMEVSPKGARGMLRIHEVGGLAGKYDLSLPRRRSALVALPESMPIRFAVLDGISVPTTMELASLSAASAREAIMMVDGAIAPMSTVKFQVSDGLGGFLASDVYAKILRTEEMGGYLLHFTSVPPEVEQLLAELVTAAGARALPTAL
jgi:class 3 adenylate cyclase/CheY-like chemotaxis protein